jgi:hypothetical protein
LQHREARFFFSMACVVAAVIVTGFGGYVATGRVTFAAQPWYAHVHAFVFFGWTALFVLQSWLVANRNGELHRKLGWLSVVWVPAMVALGIVLIVNAARYKPSPPGAPPIIDILTGNVIQMLTFAVLVAVGIALRRRTAAHRRLMFIATSLLTAQAFGRLVSLLVTPGPATGAIVIACVAAFPIIGAVHDKWLHGRVHPLWWLGIAIQPLFLAAIELLPASPVGNAMLHLLLDGTPGAAQIPPL